MGKKRRGSVVHFTMCNPDSCEVSDGRIIIRPEISIYGSFDQCFAELFVAYATDKLSSFVCDDLRKFLPKPSPAPAPTEEVPHED